jgi:hypothetical protein
MLMPDKFALADVVLALELGSPRDELLVASGQSYIGFFEIFEPPESKRNVPSH